MTDIKELAHIRREFGHTPLTEENVLLDPLQQFNSWLEEAMEAGAMDANAMVLSTVDAQGLPDSRVVLLKAVTTQGFVFFTNYQSHKAEQLAHSPYAALNFYWPEIMRQVRIRGKVYKTSPQESHAYFATRPLLSQISAVISRQSKEIPNREYLEKAFATYQQTSQTPINCPAYWGGYSLIAEEIEFWQGQANRLHDRLHFYKESGSWRFHRLAP